MMNQEIKNKWVDALRSGKYEQGMSYLNNNGKFCCLGVLCDLVDSSKWTVSDPDVPALFQYENHGCTLPVIIKEAVQMPVDAMSTLIDMNDGDSSKDILPSSFSVIADWIEANL